MALGHIYTNIIYIYLHILSNLILEDMVNQPLVGCYGILQAKRHNLITITPFMSDKRYFLLIFLFHWDLVVPLSIINEAIQTVTSS